MTCNDSNVCDLQQATQCISQQTWGRSFSKGRSSVPDFKTWQIKNTEAYVSYCFTFALENSLLLTKIKTVDSQCSFVVEQVMTYLMSNIGHLLFCKVSWSSAIPLLQLSAWSRELCVLEEPPLNHNSLGRSWAHYQIAGSIEGRRHTHWMSCFTGRPWTTTKGMSINIWWKYLENIAEKKKDVAM